MFKYGILRKMMFFQILITGILAGLLPSLLRFDTVKSISNVITGIAGAFIGAFLGFGDAPLLLQYPFLNEITLMIGVAVAGVFIKVLIMKKSHSS